MRRHQFGERQVVVYRSPAAPRWTVYCPCCQVTVARLFMHGNALESAHAHARVWHT